MPVMTSELILKLKDGVTGPARLATSSLEKLVAVVRSGAKGGSFGGGLGAMAANLKREAASIRGSIDGLRAGSHALGTALAGIGIGHGIKEFIEAGAEYRKELIALKNSGRTSQEIAQGIAASNNLITTIPTSSLTENIKLLNETTAAFGNFGHALENLEFNSKLASNLHATLGEKVGSTGDMFNKLVRAFEIRGTAFDPKKYQREAGELARAFTFTRGNVNPESFLTFASNANPAISFYNERFLTKIVPSLIQELGADKAGTGLTAFRKVIKGGVTDSVQAAEWKKLGLLTGDVKLNKAGMVQGWKSGAVKGTDLAFQDPLQFMETVVLPAIKRSGVDIMDPIALGKELDVLFKNTKANAAASAIGQAVKRNALHKDEGLINLVPTMDQQYKNNMDDLGTSMTALKNAFVDLFVSMSGPLIPTIAKSVWGLASGIQGLAATINAHPFLGTALGLSAGILAGVASLKVFTATLSMLGLTGIGPIKLLRLAFLDLSIAGLAALGKLRIGLFTLLNPLAWVRGALRGLRYAALGITGVAVLGGIALAGKYIYDNWSNIGVAFEAFKGAFLRAIEPVRPILQPILDDIQSILTSVTNLVPPVDDMGTGWAKMGIDIGKVVGTDLVPWATSIRAVWDAVKGLGAAWAWLQQPVDFRPFIASIKAAASQSYKAFIDFDWKGLGISIVRAIIEGIESAASGLGSAIGDAIKKHLPAWMGGSGDSGGGDSPPIGPNGRVTPDLDYHPSSSQSGLNDRDRDLAIRTIVAEAGGEGETGMAAVAQVIKNRAASGNYGGHTLGGVVMAPRQFSAWNVGDPARGIAEQLRRDSPQYRRAGEILDGVVSGAIPDMTGGADHYYNPSQANPAWGDSLGARNDVRIGHHRFVGGNGVRPAQPPMSNKLQDAVDSASKRKTSQVHYNPHLALTIHNGQHMNEEKLSSLIFEKLHGGLSDAMDAHFSDHVLTG